MRGLYFSIICASRHWVFNLTLILHGQILLVGSWNLVFQQGFRDASRSYCMRSASVIGKLITKAILCIREETAPDKLLRCGTYIVMGVQIGKSPSGELRYPSLSSQKLNLAWSCELGEFQWCDKVG
ncbi:putative UDP-N-acetylglucosamine--peptide N-acetylglucosaminyltransferase SEC [Trifolium repens]|nr:putative UDP-N-acetylglucosamine--peptide N-acetylglucosaminyltransferase SEC [Trifolium repens]